jgi:hypothetical protein
MSRSWQSWLGRVFLPARAGRTVARRPKRNQPFTPALEVLETRLAPANFVWTGTESTLWSDSANWLNTDTQAVPTRAPGKGMRPGEVDSVEFDGRLAARASRNTTVDNANPKDQTGYQLGSLRIDTDYTGGTITLNKPLTVTQQFIMEGRSTIQGPADLVIQGGTATWDAGTMKGAAGKDAPIGKTVIGAGVALTLGGTITLDTRALETSAGTLLQPVQTAKNTTFNLSGQAVLAVKGGYFAQSNEATLNLAGQSKIINTANFKMAESAGDITVGPQASIVNNGSFRMDGGRLLAPEGASPGKFTNTSTFFLGTGVNTPIPLVFDNSGIFSLALAGGKPSSVRFLGGGTFSGSFQGSTLQFTSVVFDAQAGAQPPAYTWLNGLTFGKYPNEVTAVGVATPVTIPAASAVSILKGTTLVLGKKGGITGNGKLTIDGGGLKVPGRHEASISGGVQLVLTGNGVMDGGGNLTISGSGGFFWESGTMEGTGRTDLATATQIGKNQQKLVLGRSITILKGTTVTIQNAGNIRLAAADFTVINAGTVDIKDDSGFAADPVGGITRTFFNYKGGLVKKSGGTGTSTFPQPFEFDNQGGALRVESGTLKVVNGKQDLVPATTTLNRGRLNTDGLFQLEGGVLENVGASALDGEVFGDVLNTGGEVDPGGAGSPGILTIDGVTGSYTQQGAGALAIDIAGPTPGLGYDQLVVTGPLYLGGRLVVSAAPGFTGDSFTIVKDLGPGPTPGHFDGLPEGATLTLDGRAFRITYRGGASGQDVVLSAVTRSTITTVSGSPNPSVYGQPVTFTATVAAANPGAGVPTGSVQFQIDGVNFGAPVPLAAGRATSAATATLPAGAHTVTALYSGDATFLPSGNSATQTVNPAGTVTTVATNRTTSVFGEPIDFTAHVGVVAPGAGTPTGTVAFKRLFPDGSSVTFGTAPLDASGNAVFVMDHFVPATATVFAVYLGAGNFSGSTSATITHVINKADTTLTLSASSLVVVAGQPLQFSSTLGVVPPGAFVAPATGTLTLYDTYQGTTTVLTTIPVGESGTFPSLTGVGAHVITAVYSGDSDFNGSTSSSITVQAIPAG